MVLGGFRWFSLTSMISIRSPLSVTVPIVSPTSTPFSPNYTRVRKRERGRERGWDEEGERGGIGRRGGLRKDILSIRLSNGEFLTHCRHGSWRLIASLKSFSQSN